MNKKLILDAVVAHLDREYQTALAAAKEAHATATHSESVAENKYDTFGLEASYLAQGQARRVEELATALHRLRQLTAKAYDAGDAIGMGALVELEREDGSAQFVLLAPGAGGVKLVVEGKTITVVTPTSPLGSALMGRFVDDEVKMENKAGKHCTWIVSVC